MEIHVQQGLPIAKLDVAFNEEAITLKMCWSVQADSP